MPQVRSPKMFDLSRQSVMTSTRLFLPSLSLWQLPRVAITSCLHSVLLTAGILSFLSALPVLGLVSVLWMHGVIIR